MILVAMLLASAPADVGARWCRALAARDEAAAVALMTPELARRVERLRRRDRAFRAANPGEKPPLGDGLRLTAFPDAIGRCSVAPSGGSRVAVTVVPRGAPAGGWQDVLKVRAGRVSDVQFGTDRRDTLRRWLRSGGG